MIKQIRKNLKLFLTPYKHVNIYISPLNLIYIGISKTGISSIRSMLLDKVGADYDEESYKSIHKKVGYIFKYIPAKEVFKKRILSSLA